MAATVRCWCLLKRTTTTASTITFTGLGTSRGFERRNRPTVVTNFSYLRVNDWLHGIRAAEPDREALESLTSDPLTDAERLRLVHHIITAPASEGGAAITPKTGEWNNVESIFPLHDHTFNRAWIKKWSVKTFLKVEDLDEIRSKFGEKVSVNLSNDIALC